ncbi:unnamed protein product [Pylaiella littoralis]
MQRAEKNLVAAEAAAAGAGSAPLLRSGTAPPPPTAVRQSGRPTSVPLRVSLDYETSALVSSRVGSGVSSGGDGGESSSTASRSYSAASSSVTDDISNGSGDSGGSGSSRGKGAGAPSNGTLSWRNVANVHSSISGDAPATAATAANNGGRLQWSASSAAVEDSTRRGRGGGSGTRSCSRLSRGQLPPAAATSRGKRRPASPRISVTKKGRGTPAPKRGRSGGGSTGGDSSIVSTSGGGSSSSVANGNGGSGGGGGGDGGNDTTAMVAATPTTTATTSAGADAEAGVGVGVGVGVGAGVRAGAGAGPVTSWRGSLGSWERSGGFKCPVNPLEEWGIPGCGKLSRTRDTTCDSCHRVLRTNWHVGASAAVGSGVENPELKLNGIVTFQNKRGITYTGRVVAIDPRPRPEAPRGVVRVKYDDWPFDKYDEDANMEVVTPFGWVPTPVGRAGRRASKRPVQFTPNTGPCYHRKPAVQVVQVVQAPVVPVELGEGSGIGSGEGSGEGKEGASSGPGSEGSSGEETEEESSSEGEEAAPPPVKIWVCRHVRRGIARPVNKSGECQACRNASAKAKAGIKMCRHVREGEARAYGRGHGRCPPDYGRGHCRECTVKRYPLKKKMKVPKPRLWPSCAMPRCRKRHYAWGMCSTCLAAFKATHPNANPQLQGRRKSGKSTFRFTGEDAEFTDSSDDDSISRRPAAADAAAALKKVKVENEARGEGEGEDDGDTAAVAAAKVASEAGRPDQSPETMMTDEASEMSGSDGNSSESFGSGGGKVKADSDTVKKGQRKGTRAGGDTSRQGKRARVVNVAADDPTCFYCWNAAGHDVTDELLYCADFDCNRTVHMKCCTPPLDEVPDRFYCAGCVKAGKDAACENPCMACGSNDRDDLILVCDRDKCYSYFHCYCLPQPLDSPPEGEYVCPRCTGEELERGMVIAKSSGGTRPPREAPPSKVKGEPKEKQRTCSACSKRCKSQTMWTCASGKELCKGKMFHRKCLVRGKKAAPETAGAPLGAGAASTVARRVPSHMEDLWGVVAEGAAVGGGVGAAGAGSGRGVAEAMEVRDLENFRLCCPDCGYDLLKVDVVDVLTEEQAYEGTTEQEQSYKTFERALKMSLEDPRFGIGQTREEFEEPFKGSIGSGANRTAMYGSVFEAAVDQMFRNSKLTSRHKFLDIGCGIGSIVLQAAAWAGCQATGIEIVEDRFAGAVQLHSAFQKTVSAEQEFRALMHPGVVERQVHLFKGCFMEQWETPEIRDADFIFFNNSSGWFNNSKALNNPDEHSLESRLLSRLKNDTSNSGKILITLEHIAEWQPDCWERRTYKYSNETRRAATYAANELEFWEYTVVSQWECPGCTSLNTDAVNDCVVCGTYCRGKRNSKRL